MRPPQPASRRPEVRSVAWQAARRPGWRVLDGVRRRPTLWFFLFAYAFSWGDWLATLRAGEMVRVGPGPSHFPGLLGPMLAGLLVTAATRGRVGLRDLSGRMAGAAWRSL